MNRSDPAEQALIRLELRRFVSRCDAQEGLIQRADSLREIARLITISIPYKLSNEFEARDLQRKVVQMAEQRARELIAEQIETYIRGEPSFRDKMRSKMRDDWGNLTGALGHLRTWAQNRLNVAEQNQ
jgi:hypothetical protein